MYDFSQQTTLGKMQFGKINCSNKGLHVICYDYYNEDAYTCD